MPTFSVRSFIDLSYLADDFTDVKSQRLVRFLAKDGRTYYGDAILPAGVSDVAKTTQARIINGDIFGKHNVTDQIAVGNLPIRMAVMRLGHPDFTLYRRTLKPSLRRSQLRM